MEAVGRLAGGVAHDFNNLLTVILGYGDLAADRDRRSGDPLRSRPREISRGRRRGAALTRQLLAFSRKQVLQPRCSTSTTSSGAWSKHAAPAHRRGHRARDSILGADLWPVKADPGQIEQVLMNLAVNARDAMPEGGRLTIETANVELDDGYRRRSTRKSRPGRYVLLAVTDTGCGMDRGHAEPHLRAVLHDQGAGQGHRPGAGHGLRHREAERRWHRGRQRAGAGHDLQGLPARSAASALAEAAPVPLRRASRRRDRDRSRCRGRRALRGLVAGAF